MATDYNGLKVVDLKAELKRRGLSYVGRKTELVSRLEEADAAPSTGAQSVEEPTVEEIPDAGAVQSTTSIDEPTAVEEQRGHAESEDAIPIPDQDPAQSTTLEPQVADDAPTPKPAGQVINTSVSSQIIDSSADTNEPLADLPRATSSEVLQDGQKRKRRSASPPPSGHDTPRKRARVSGDSISEDTNGNKASNAEAASISAPNGVSKENEKTQTVEQEEAVDYGADSPIAASVRDEARDITPTPADYAGVRAQEEHRSPERSAHDIMDFERDVEPAVHPATSSLYIKNFMRPLREPVVEQYLIDLATPSGAAPDPEVIVDFFLDNIRTHAFVNFKSISAASRVRTALHQVVWPDESNRKPLWVDFIPPSEINGWIDKEQSGGGRGRNASSRWEVVYDTGSDGAVTAVLQEAGLDPKPMRPPTGPAARSDIPTGPAQPYPGIEAAPSGPRGYLDRAPRGPARAGHDNGPVETARASPPITYQPVPEDVARRRLESIHSFLPRGDGARRRDPGRDKNRFTFQAGDEFVNRGPEVFEGIRPPHRERERRRQGGRGPPPFSRGFGGGGRNRGPRAGYDDYRPPQRRYDDFRGGGGGGGGGWESYRDRRY